jgi:hypothetical protein
MVGAHSAAIPLDKRKTACDACLRAGALMFSRSSSCLRGQRVWFKFNKAFINANYDNGEAFGQIQAQTWRAAKTVHSTKCGGDDGELHVGALESGLGLPTSQSPTSGKASADDSRWGVVFGQRNRSASTVPGAKCLENDAQQRGEFSLSEAGGSTQFAQWLHP